MPGVYLIYVAADEPYAAAIRTVLRNNGIVVQPNAPPRLPLDEHIARSILSDGQKVIVLLSQDTWATPSAQNGILALLASLREHNRSDAVVAKFVDIAMSPLLNSFQVLDLAGLPPAYVAQAILREFLSDLDALSSPRTSAPPPPAQVAPPPAPGGPPPVSRSVSPPSPAGEEEIEYPALRDSGLPDESLPAPAAGPPTAWGSATFAGKAGTSQDQQKRRESSPSEAVDTLQFSAYHPQALSAGTWSTMLVYTYVAAALAQIQADAATFTELGSKPNLVSGAATRAVAEGVELTIEPHMDGVSFSPPTESFIWRGQWHRSLFRSNGDAALAGKTQQGWIDIYADGLVPIARIDLNFPFHTPGVNPLVATPHGVIVTSNVHDRVFISYNHHDKEAFDQACEVYKRFSIQVLCDEQLAAGDDYERTLMQMIDTASVFHLLWSSRAALSPECRKEWLHALMREHGERFVKPWYWKRPLITPPTEFSQHHISFRYQHLRRKWWHPVTW